MVSVEVPTVSVNMRPSVYRDLLQIGRHVSYEEVEVVSNEKQTLLSNAQKMGEIHVLE